MPVAASIATNLLLPVNSIGSHTVTAAVRLRAAEIRGRNNRGARSYNFCFVIGKAADFAFRWRRGSGKIRRARDSWRHEKLLGL
jgi:hypothetical protein